MLLTRSRRNLSFGRYALMLLTVAAVAAVPLHAQAQAPEELARRLVGEGIEAAKARDWITARDRFQKAYKIQPLPLTLYNLAAAQEKTEQFVEADRSFRIFLRETQSGENADFRKVASDHRVALRDKIAHLVLRSDNVAVDDKIMIGDREISRAALGEAIPSNPGTFTVNVERSGATVTTQTFRLGEGQSQTVELDVPPLPDLPKVAPPTAATNKPRADTAAVTTAQTEPEEGSVLSSPVFWGVLAAVVVAGAGVGGYFALRPSSPFESTLPRIETGGR